jgi:hypothetical protein
MDLREAAVIDALGAADVKHLVAWSPAETPLLAEDLEWMVRELMQNPHEAPDPRF